MDDDKAIRMLINVAYGYMIPMYSLFVIPIEV